MSKRKDEPIHPGEILLEEFLKPMSISQHQLAKDISVPPRRISGIVSGVRSINADTAIRLSRYFSLSERFWLNLQSTYDLEVEKDKLKGRIENEVKVLGPPELAKDAKTRRNPAKKTKKPTKTANELMLEAWKYTWENRHRRLTKP